MPASQFRELRDYLRGVAVSSRQWVVVLLPGILFSSVLFAQRGGAPAPVGTGVKVGANVVSQEGASLTLRILDEKKKAIDTQAMVKITNQTTGAVQFHTTHAATVLFENLPEAKYTVEVSAAGYAPTRAEFIVKTVESGIHGEIVLNHDPGAPDLTLHDASDIPSKARKDAEKGAQALQTFNYAEARKHLEAANHEYGSSAKINFLLAYLAQQQNDPERELGYLKTAAQLNPKDLPTQGMLATLYFQRGDFPNAAAAEATIVATHPDYAPAHKLLANYYLKLKEFEKARSEAQWVIDHDPTEANSARLLLGQALANLHKYVEALSVMKQYLAEDPNSSVAGEVKSYIAEIEQRASQVTVVATTAAPAEIADPTLAAERPPVPPNTWLPADVDSERPPVAAGTPCPADLLDRTADKAKDLVDNVARFSAIEDLVHENLDLKGNPITRETRKFDYLAAISEPSPGALVTSEYRDSADGITGLPDHIATNGLAVLALAFHPTLRDDFTMTCEGLGSWQGQAAWLVHFRQRDDRPSRLQLYRVNGQVYDVRLKGRAWITADNFEIVHLETDLIKPIPEIRLMTEHTSINYGPVLFKKSNTDLWLPKSAELYVDFYKHRFYRKHSFDHFMLFSTDADETVHAPKSASVPSPSQSQ